ncbi:hypothetical protein RKE29_11710, partial [Streptomyces sp. B1866]|uniref:hypothetical protein n=1 Tax=Streptomyces sp. B1866 TaxID=3075431 RepID=UPI002890DC0B
HLHESPRLKKERDALPDPVVARDDNTCDKSSFGDRDSGKYYFNLSRINGSDTLYEPLDVRSVTVEY